MRILFIGGEGNSIDANSVCIRNMTHELINQGHVVYILAMGTYTKEMQEMLDGAFLYEYPMDLFRRITLYYNKNKDRFLLSLFYRAVCMLRHFILLFFYPNTSPIRAKKLSRRAFRIVEDNHIDTIVSIYCPYDNIYSGIYLKQRLGDRIRVISYHLDLRTGSASQSHLVRSFIHKHALSSLIHEFNVVDKVLIPYSGQKDIEGLNYSRKDKIQFVGFPVYINEPATKECSLPFTKDIINISYIGTLYPGNREPNYFLSLCEKVSKHINIRVHFWGIIDNYISVIDSYNFAEYHGLIDNCYVSFIMKNSDFLLNIGNKLAYDMLPSKVFGLFATGKPIINMVTHPLDATRPYFNRYDNSLDILEYELNEDSARDLEEYLISHLNAPLKDSRDLFDDFKPERFVQLLLY